MPDKRLRDKGDVDKEVENLLGQMDLPSYEPAEKMVPEEDKHYRPARKYQLRYRRKALENYWDFIKLLNYRGGPSKFGAIHYELADFLQHSGKRRLILMPRGHLKSTLCSVGYVLWRIYQNPDIRIIVGTATKPLAESFVREIKQYLEDPELREHVWDNRPHISGPLIPDLDRSSKPRSRRLRGDDENFDEGYTEAVDKKVVWKGTQLQVVRPGTFREPTLVSSSVGTPNTGFHFDLAIFDDLVTFDNSDTPAKAERIMSWVADMESVVDPYNPETDLGEEVVMLGTRYYHRDLYGLFSKEDLSEEEKEDYEDGELSFMDASDDWQVFKRNIYANGHDDSEGYLWPERFNGNVIRRIRGRMMRLKNATRRFASQYLNTIVTDEEIVLNPQLINYIMPQHAKQKGGLTVVQAKSIDEAIKLKPYIVVDPAISMSKRADNTVVMVGAVDDQQNLYVLDIKAGKLKTTEVIDAIYNFVDKFNVYSIHIDNEKLGQALMQSIKQAWRDDNKKAPLCLVPFTAKGEKKGRIAAHLQPRFTNNQVYMLGWMAKHSILQEEIMFFPRDGAHDDCLDAMAMICEIALPYREKSQRKAYNPLRNSRYNSRYGGIR